MPEGVVDEYTMDFEATTIEHLSFNLYSFLPSALAEFVSNAWDADAASVEITIPEGPLNSDSEIIVRDFGTGMDRDILQQAYLYVGRNRRQKIGADGKVEKIETSAAGRRVMGRKGIGKLAAFGVATEMEVRSIRGQNAVCLRLDYESMRKTPRGAKYKPQVIGERSGPTTEPDGTEIRIRRLKRKNRIDLAVVRRELARRFPIAIGRGFEVKVNTVALTIDDRLLRNECKLSWPVEALPAGKVIDSVGGWEVDGWVGFLPTASSNNRGIDIFARGRSVQLGTFFNLGSTHAQWARAYLVGEIYAEFLDEDEDHVGTGRDSAQWETEAGARLQEWGQTVVRWAFDQWLNTRKEHRHKEIVRTADFESWLKTRTARERKVAEKLIKTIVDDDNIEPESAGPLLDIIKTNIEFQAFQDLVDDIETSGANVQTLLKLVSDWRVLEAREHLRLSDGRREVTEKLRGFINTGALEVQQIQPLFEENGWLIEPAWGNVDGQTTYSKLLRNKWVEPNSIDPKDRRMDILGFAVSGTVWVVELKRPERTVTYDDLTQIERYVDWARSNFVGTGEHAPTHVRGLLLVGKLSTDKSVRDKMVRLAGDDIRVDTFDTILRRAEEAYKEVERRLKAIAPEYAREARKTRRVPVAEGSIEAAKEEPPTPAKGSSTVKRGASKTKGKFGRGRRGR